MGKEKLDAPDCEIVKKQGEARNCYQIYGQWSHPQWPHQEADASIISTSSLLWICDEVGEDFCNLGAKRRERVNDEVSNSPNVVEETPSMYGGHERLFK